MGISKRLRIAIDQAGLKLTEAPKRTGIPYRSLQNYVHGERQPTAEAMRERFG